MGAGGVGPGPVQTARKGVCPAASPSIKRAAPGGSLSSATCTVGTVGAGSAAGAGGRAAGAGAGVVARGRRASTATRHRASTAAAARAVDEALRRAAGVTVPRVVGGAVGAETAAGSTALAEGVADDTPRGVSEGNGGGRLGTTSATATGPLWRNSPVKPGSGRPRAWPRVRIAAMRSSIVAKRSAGSFARQRYTRASTPGGISTVGLIDARVGTSSVTWAIKRLTELALSKGTRPVSISKSITPSAYTSVAADTRSPRICSGAMYFGEPINSPVCVRASSGSSSVRLSRPKSSSLTKSGSSSWRTR